jgi:nucleoside-diphosphate-sugar epimerase
MRILITGNMGYVGSVLVPYLRQELPEAELIGFDSGFFGHCLTHADVLPECFLDQQIFGDIRTLQPSLLKGVDAVVHLAALSNDPIAREFETLTEEINRVASVRLAHLAAEAEVKHFVFASSCAIYGYAEGGARKETDPKNPLTAYARSKIGTETDLATANLHGMVFTSLRFATACGMSERLRLDLVLNDFVASALVTGEITILSDGTPWRPLIDVEDMARAIFWALQRSPENGGTFLAVNVGKDEHNFQVRELAEAVARNLPGTAIRVNSAAPPDKRSYRVDFSLFKSLAGSYVPRVTLDDSIVRLCDGLRKMNFSERNFRESNFIRLNTLRRYLASQRLNKNLEWQP